MKKLHLLLMVLLPTIAISQQLPQKIDTNNQIIEHDGYVLSYNETCEQANWVFYKLTPDDLICNNKVSGGSFKEDTLVQTNSANPNDYRYSGYDRGHLKPAGDEPCSKADRYETYIMSNVTPQNPSFNRGMWKKLENYTRKVVLSSDSTYIICGGILSDTLKTLPNTDICIPKYYFKVIYCYKNGIRCVECFIMPNKRLYGDISKYETTIEKLEKLSNIKFSIDFD